MGGELRVVLRWRDYGDANRIAQRMMGQLDVEALSAPRWAAQAGRQALAALLAFAFLGTALLLVVATETQPSAPELDSPAVPAGSALRIALDGVLTTVSVAGIAEGGETTPAADDAWQTLAVVHERIEAQLRVAEGARPPLMGAVPPAPQRAVRDDALLRAALTYVRGALATHDVVAVGRARDLLESAREG